MDDTPSFLPPLLDLDGDWNAILLRLYAVFVKDFKESKTYHRGIKVIYNGTVKDDGLRSSPIFSQTLEENSMPWTVA